MDFASAYNDDGPFFFLDYFVQLLPEEIRPPYLSDPEILSYAEPRLASCMQIDENNFVIIGEQNLIFEIRPRSEAHDTRANRNRDKNMFLQYFWRVTQVLKGDFESKKMDLVWIAHEYKMMVIGSTSSSTLYLYSFYFDKIKFDEVAIEASTYIYNTRDQFNLER